MKQQREETMAAALWAYVERLRQQDGGRVDGITPDDVEELAKTLGTAGDLHAALQADAAPAYGTAAARVRAAIAAQPQPRAERPAPPPRGWLRAPAFRRAAAASVLAACLAVAFVSGRQSLGSGALVAHSHPASISCRECREHFQALEADRLSDQEARDLLWHLAKCRSCYSAYHDYEEQHPQQRSAAPGPSVLAAR